MRRTALDLLSSPSMVAPLLAGRYRLYEPIASGGMATVHFGRQVGEAGFARTIAIKRVHPKHFGKGAMVSSLVDEARLASRIQHPNVVPTLDVFQAHGEIFVVMEFVMGETLARLQRAHIDREEPMPISIALSIAIGMLQGLHAAHEAKNERGQPLSIVHRDVSPQNVLVGVDGLARVLDFGIAKAEERLTATLNGHVKGKPRYMAPEQIRAESVTRRTDIFAAGIVLWESLAGRRLYESDAEVVVAYSERRTPEPAAKHNPNVPAKLDAVLRRALVFEPDDRFEDAATFALALEEVGDVASPRRVSEWVKTTAGASLRERAEMIAGIERESSRETIHSEAQAEETRPDNEPAPKLSASAARHRAPDEDATRVGPLPDAVTVIAPAAAGLALVAADGESANSKVRQPAETGATAPEEALLESTTLEVKEPPSATKLPPARDQRVEAPSEPAPRERRGVASPLVAFLALGAGAVAAVLVFVPRPSVGKLADHGPPEQISEPARTTVEAPAMTTDAVASTGTKVAGATASATASTSAPLAHTEGLPSAVRVWAAGQPSHEVPGSRPTLVTEPPPKANDPCSPPFVIDKNNVKRFKPECL